MLCRGILPIMDGPDTRDARYALFYRKRARCELSDDWQSLRSNLGRGGTLNGQVALSARS